MPNRHASSGDYRYGMNGMEQDSEVKGGGNSYTSYWRQYDPRLGRWLSIDPVNYPWQSDYAAFDNNPVFYSDPSGAQATGGDKVKVKGNKTNTTGKWETKHGDGSLTGKAAGSFDLEEFSVVEGSGGNGSWTSEVSGAHPTFSYSGSFGQWKNAFGYSGDYNDVNAAWEDKHGDEFNQYVENEIIEERGRIAVEKMKWFILAFEAESYVLGPVTGLNSYNSLSSPKTFNYNPRGRGMLFNNSPEGAIKFRLGENAGLSYKSVAQRGLTVNNPTVKSVLNSNSKGTWKKVINAAEVNGQRMEVHYFQNTVNGKIANFKVTKVGKWSKQFTKGPNKVTGN